MCSLSMGKSKSWFWIRCFKKKPRETSADRAEVMNTINVSITAVWRARCSDKRCFVSRIYKSLDMNSCPSQRSNALAFTQKEWNRSLTPRIKSALCLILDVLIKAHSLQPSEPSAPLPAAQTLQKQLNEVMRCLGLFSVSNCLVFAMTDNSFTPSTCIIIKRDRMNLSVLFFDCTTEIHCNFWVVWVNLRHILMSTGDVLNLKYYNLLNISVQKTNLA